MRTYKFDELDSIVFEIKNGKCAIVETDTVMGIVGLDNNKIYKIKKRHLNKKLIFLINKIEYIKGLTDSEKKILKKYWPGPLTIIKDGFSYRMPNHPKLMQLLAKTGPLFSSSANLSGQDPVIDYQEAQRIFKDFNWDLIIVEGKNISTQPSTIISFDNHTVIREGKIDGRKIIDELEYNERE